MLLSVMGLAFEMGGMEGVRQVLFLSFLFVDRHFSFVITFYTTVYLGAHLANEPLKFCFVTLFIAKVYVRALFRRWSGWDTR